jgi:hypothetical protein
VNPSAPVAELTVSNAFLCATDREWVDWIALWDRARTRKRPTDDAIKEFCADCTPDFQAEMVAQNRCVLLCGSRSEGAGESGAAPCDRATRADEGQRDGALVTLAGHAAAGSRVCAND